MVRGFATLSVITKNRRFAMPSILFLISPPSSVRQEPMFGNDNADTLPTAFRAAGWKVTQALHQSIHRKPSGLASNHTDLCEYDLLWPIGFGPRRGFLDWLQLINELPERKVINAPSALVLAHGKGAWLQQSADSYIAADPQTLIDAMQKDGGDWVVKPLAGSFGEGVIQLHSDQATALTSLMNKRSGEYFVLQRFLPEITLGETRTLVVGGQIIGSYLRVPTNQLHANLAKHGQAQVTNLSSAQAALIEQIIADLQSQHIGFAAIDLVGDTLMEVNIANPGGLSTLNSLYRTDFGPATVRAALGFIDKA